MLKHHGKKSVNRSNLHVVVELRLEIACSKCTLKDRKHHKGTLRKNCYFEFAGSFQPVECHRSDSFRSQTSS